MSKKSNSIFKQNSPVKKNSNTTKQDNIARIAQENIGKRNAQLDQDERIQQRLEQIEAENELYREALQEEKEQLEAEYKELRQQLQTEIEQQKEEIEKAKATLNDKRVDLQNERQELLTAYENREKQLIEQIQQNEQKILEAQRVKLFADWQQQMNQQEQQLQQALLSEKEQLEAMKKQQQQLLHDARVQAEKTLLAATTEAQQKLQQAHDSLVDAEEKKVKRIQEARQKLEAKYAELNADYEAKLLEVIEKEQTLKNRQMMLSISEQDVELMQVEYKKKQQFLEKQLSELSPSRVEQLQFEIRRLQETKEADYQIIEQLKDEIKSLKKLIPEDELRSMSVIAEEVESLKHENKRLLDILAQTPSEKELIYLKSLPKKVEMLEENLIAERQSRINAEGRAENLQIGVLELEQTKRVTETLKTVNAQLQQELDKINEVYKQNTQSKFPGLVEIDHLIATQPPMKKQMLDITLQELVTYLQNYGATQLGLYYSDKMIRAFIASLAASKLIILQGLSGTGKSSLARLFKEAVNVKQTLIPVQPSWRDNRELLGYDNDFTRRFKETVFTKKLYEASAPENQQNAYFIVLDEMNLARIEYYFADFLAVMEEHKDDWKVALVSNNEELEVNRPKYLVENGTSLMITQNIWFIGTANRDESTFGITDKVYDRAQVINFVKREEKFDAQPVDKIDLSFEQFNHLLTAPFTDAKHQLTSNEHQLLQLIDVQLQEDFEITFGNRILMQLERFVATYSAAGGSKLDAIDYVIAHKVLRKLEGRYESYMVKKLKELLENLENLGGPGSFTECRQVIEVKLNRLGE